MGLPKGMLTLGETQKAVVIGSNLSLSLRKENKENTRTRYSPLLFKLRSILA